MSKAYLLASIGLYLLPATAMAQEATDRIDPLIREDEAGRSPSDEERVPESPPPPTTIVPPTANPTRALPTILVGAVQIDGLEVLRQADFMPVIEPVIGQTLGAGGQRALVEAITRRMHKLGYPLAVAAIAPQRVSAGVLRVRVDEGRIDTVRVEGDGNTHVERLLSGLANGQPVTKAALERAILLAEAVPGVRVRRARLVQAGRLNILSVLLRETRVSGRIGVDNWGGASIGPIKARGRVAVRGVLADGDEVVGYVAVTPIEPGNSQYASLAYSAPVDANGTRMGVSGSVARIEAIGVNTGRLLEGDGTRVAMWVAHPLLLSRRATLAARLGFNLRDTSQGRDGVTTRDERVAALTARASGSTRFDEVRLWGSAELVQGTGWFGSTREGDPFASRRDGDSVFTKVELSGAALVPVAGPMSLRFDLEGQVASRPLFAADEFGYGGRSFGRGYFFREAAGDNAVAGSIELRIDVPRDAGLMAGVQFYGYGDAARLWNLGGGGREDLATAGVGFRANVTRRLGLGVEMGVPIDQDRAPRGNVETWFRF
ncbi:ShlB/FhaC/HecB family hemolysin secretion/activation protein [Sphingomonas sp.]